MMTNRRHPRAIALALVVLAAAAGSACEVPNPGPTDVIAYPQPGMTRTANDVPYGTEDQQVLDVYRPARQNGGAILWIHGGSWFDFDGLPNSIATEDASAIVPTVRALYRQGWTVFSARYSGLDEATWPSPLQDLKVAVRWIKANAAVYGVSKDWVIAMGFSAGGHLAAMLGVTAGTMEPVGLPPELDAQDSRPAGVVSLAGVLDPVISNLTPQSWRDLGTDAMATTRVSSWDNPGDPPMYLAGGDHDGGVNVNTQLIATYRHVQRTLGDANVWIDVVSTGRIPTGADVRAHTMDLSYGLHQRALLLFLDSVRPTVRPGG